MIIRYHFTILIVLLIIPSFIIAQKEDKKFLENFEKGTQLMIAGKTDSSIICFEQAYNWLKKNSYYDSSSTATQLYSHLGRCYRLVEKPQLSQELLIKALNNARKYKHINDIGTIFLRLTVLHKLIAEKNWSFNYTAPKETKTTEAYFQISSITPIKNTDSVEIKINAGLLDGIINKEQTCRINSRMIPKDTLYHKSVKAFASAPFYKIDSNASYVHIPTSFTNRVLVGDFIVAEVEMPIEWNKLTLQKTLLNNDIFKYINDDYYGYRLFYYYGDTQLEEDLFNAMLLNVKNSAHQAMKDTSVGNIFSEITKEGIFVGKTLGNAILESNTQHIKLFFEYENAYPANNIGNEPSFYVKYITWIYNGTDMIATSIKPYLLSLQNVNERQQQIKNLYTQIKTFNLCEEWEGEALQNIRDENYQSAAQNALLIKDISGINNDSIYKGWAEFLFANIEHSKGNKTLAAKYLNEASNIFNTNNNYEGKSWITSTEKSWEKNTDIHIQMQNGHTLHFITAFSPNGKYFATGSTDQLIKIWNKITGKEIHTIGYHTDKIISLHYSPNGKYIVSVGADKQIAVWNAYNYELLNSFNSDGETQVAKFSPDSKQLYLTEDSVLYIINLFSDSLSIAKKATLHNNIINDFVFFNNNPNIIITASDDSTVSRWDLESMTKRGKDYTFNAKVKSLAQSNNYRYLSIITEDALHSVLDAYTGNFILQKKIFLDVIHYYYSSKFAAMYAVHSFSTDSKVIAVPVAKDSFRIYNLADQYYRQYPYKTDNYGIRSTLFMPDGKDLMITSNAYDFGLIDVKDYDFEKKSGINTKRIDFYANQINKVQYSDDDNSIHYTITEGNYGKLNLSSANLFINYNTLVNLPKTSFICYDNDNFFPIKKGSQSNTVYVYDKNEDSFIHTITLDSTEDVNYFTKSKDNRLIYVTGVNGQIIGYDTKTATQLFNTHVSTTDVAHSMYLYFDNDKQRLFCKTNQDYVLIFNGLTGVVTDTIFIFGTRYITTTKDRICITTSDGRLKFFNAQTLEYITGWRVNSKEFEALEVHYIPTKNQLLLQDTEKSIALYDLALDSFLYQFSLGYNCRDIAINHKETEFASAGVDGTIRLFDLATGKLKVTIFLPFKKEPFIADTLNHYYSAKNALNALNISYNNQVYPYDQFDLKLNRPDIIFSSIGRTDSSILKNYHTAYLKRLKTLGISEKQLEKTSILQLPHIKLLNRYSLESTTTDSIYTFDVSFTDENYHLQSVQVLVNNSPVFGVNGKNIASLNNKTYTTSVKVPLAYGANTIKVFCTNAIGVTSLKETFTVLSTFSSKVHKPTVYFVGIGVAKYKDSLYNLTYSAKDIRDLAADVTKYFNTVVIDTLLNEQVTKENIIKLKNRLLKTSPDDRVIVAITGHGILSDSLDFYYATYDIDFNKPEKRGLKYELIEKLLDDVPAQEKIMFIDACHSGALDKEELLALEKNNRKKVQTKSNEQTNVTGIASRSTIKIKNKNTKVNANSSFELMQKTFSDLSGSNGAIIVSAAGGMEYAFESAEWNNGVFTKAIREGIFYKNADEYYGGNKDGKVSVEELVRYINTRVADLTNEKQKPTLRRENIDFNWIIRY